MAQEIITREDWLNARKSFFEKERQMTHALDGLRAERRALPWVRIDKNYIFEGESGPCHLCELFDGRSQLAIYHFMLAPGSDHICPGCSFTMDHVDAARKHFEHADLAFAAVSRAPIEQIGAVRGRMGWQFNWVSSGEGNFNYDFDVSFKAEDREAGQATYNYGLTKIQRSPDMFGVSVFVKNAADEIFHTYSTYHRGTELLMGALNWLDLAPKGRNEEGGPMNWVRLHDAY
jgi:predicted dithiol-disulfide oxidoreductase (DUF899 family)